MNEIKSLVDMMNEHGKRIRRLESASVPKLPYIVMDNAIGDGVTDNTDALQTAVDTLVAAGGGTIRFHPGVYIINKSIVSNIGQASGVENICIQGAASSTLFATVETPTVLKASADFSGNSLLDFRYTKKVVIQDIGLDGSYIAAIGLLLGSSAGGAYYGWDRIQNCSVHGFTTIGIMAMRASGEKILFNEVSDNSTAGIYLQESGDSILVGNFINSHQNAYTGDDINMGVGLVIRESANTSVSGGKIEWNSKGIQVVSSCGVNISGIIFDTNMYWHIGVWSFDDGYSSCLSTTITGNRFLGGGIKSTSGDMGKGHIVLQAATGGNPSQVSAAITGNSFRKAGTGAYDYDATGTVGPDWYGVQLSDQSTGGYCHAIISGNDMTDCSELFTVFAAGPASVAKVVGCLTNLPDDVDSGGFIDHASSAWQYPMWIGTYALWVDATGDLRIKSSAPGSDLDGVVVGSQS